MVDDPDNPFERQDDAEDEFEPVVPSAVDQGSQKRIRDKAKREAAEGEAFWRSALASSPGRRELWRQIAEMRPFDRRFATGPNGFPQTEATWFYYGQQQAGLAQLRFLMKTDLAAATLMLKENDPYLADPPKRSRKREA